MKMVWNSHYERRKDFMVVFIPMDSMIGKIFAQQTIPCVYFFSLSFRKSGSCAA